MKTINATLRTTTGAKSKSVRATGLIPATVYGPNFTPRTIELNTKDFIQTYNPSHTSELYSLKGETDTLIVLLKEVQKHPFTDEIQSVSFYNVDENTALTADIPLKISGISMAVKNNLGFLVSPIDHLKVKCLSKDLPSEIEVSINSLENVGMSILISDIALPAGVTLHPSVNVFGAVVSIVPPQKEEKKEASAVAATPDAAAKADPKAAAKPAAKPEAKK